MFTIDIKADVKNPDAIKKLQRRSKEIARRTVAVGFPKGKLNIAHYDNGASIIDVAIWNNFGTAFAPRRDFMTPSTKRWKEFCTELANQMKMGILSGKIDIDYFLGLAGQEGVRIIQEEIDHLREPPNAPITIKGGWMRNKKSGKPFKVKGKNSSNPLIDSRDMLKATTYELREANNE